MARPSAKASTNITTKNITSGSADAQRIERQGEDLAALQAEHRDDGEQQRDQRDRADRGQEMPFVPVIAARLDQVRRTRKPARNGTPR
jgi:hypothetical protein